MLSRRVPLARIGRRTRSKYGVALSGKALAHRIYQGVQYDSRAEAEYAQTLDLCMHSVSPGERIKSWRRQVPIKLEVNGMLVCTYIADFEIEHLDGHLELIELKGFATYVWKLKHKLFRAIYPDRKLTVVKA